MRTCHKLGVTNSDVKSGQNCAEMRISAKCPFLRISAQFCSYDRFSITNTHILLDIYSINQSPSSHAYNAAFTTKIKRSLVEKLHFKVL